MPQAPVLSDIQLVSGYFLECAILNDSEQPLLTLPQENLRYRLNHGVAFGSNLADEQVLVDLSIACQPLNDQAEPLPVHGRFRLHLTFLVKSLAEFVEGKQGEINVISMPLLLTLLSVGYSTARGLIVGKTRDTVLQGFVLPLLDVRDLLKPAE